MGFMKPDSGRVLFGGKVISSRSFDFLSKIGFATQSDRLIDELSLNENCFYFGSLMGLRRREIQKRMGELLPLLKLESAKNTLVRHLSGGMAKRANILVSLIHYPSLLILDEPTVGLDPSLRSTLWTYIQQIKKKTNTTILVASHLLDEVGENCDRVLVLKGGSIVAHGTPDSFQKLYRTPFQTALKDILYHETP